MKISELTEQEVLQYARIEEGAADASPSLLLSAAKAYVEGYTGQTVEELDECEDVSIAILILCSDMYDNRQMTVDRANVNHVADTILGLHRTNLL